MKVKVPNNWKYTVVLNERNIVIILIFRITEYYDMIKPNSGEIIHLFILFSRSFKKQNIIGTPLSFEFEKAQSGNNHFSYVFYLT